MAEVIVPHRLNLEGLKWIYCRSEAEKDTLLYLLTEDDRHQYESKIVATTRSGLFYRRHTFLESVRMDSQAAHLAFSPDTQSPGPFNLQATIRSGQSMRQNENSEFLLQQGKYRWKIDAGFDDYELEIRLDGHTIYRNRHIEVDDIPF